MRELFSVVENNANLCLEVGYNSVADWCITVYDKSGGSISDATMVVSVQECVSDLAFAKAYVQLTDYLSENRGGW